jgi:FkbM family methyltransferase
VLGTTAQERIQALVERLDHYDRSQLYYQVTEIAGEQTYLRHGVALNPGDVVLDVGANVGVAAAFFADHCQAGAVHCFEPVAPLCRLLRRNLAGLDACTVHEFGLWSAAKTSEITFYPQSAAMSGLYADPDRDQALARKVLLNVGFSGEEADARLDGRYEAETLECELRTMSSVLRDESIARVDLLKIDVERAEMEVLRGVEESDWPRIAQVVIEVHDEHGRGAEISRALTRRGFRVVIDQDRPMRGTPVRMLYATRR